MTDNMFNIPEEFTDALNQGLKNENGIQLPFTAPLLWWGNGNAQSKALAKTCPALYFGGWLVEESHMDEAANGNGGLPAGFIQTEFVTRKGDSVPVYSARAIVMAPLAYRVAWVPKRDNGGFGVRYTSYQQGTSMHVQMLALLSTTTPEKTYRPWGPVILSAKAYQAGYLLDTVKIWQKLVLPVLKKIGSKTPASAFWMGIGTFGEFNQKMVGKVEQSPITPIQLFQPPTVDINLLKKIFVGVDTVASMTDYIAQAAEWLQAWKTPQASPAPSEPEWPVDELPGEDIPF